jgi:hypothetical protein
LETLENEIRAFLQSKPHTCYTDPAFDAGRYSVHIVVNAEPPARLGVICGDYIQCLRAALDHLVCGAVRKVTKRTAFPIYDDGDDFFCGVVLPARRKQRGPLTGIDPDGKLFAMIQSVQPHEGRQGVNLHPLAVLRDLSNADKHRAILPSIAAHVAVHEAVPILTHDVRVGGAEYATGEPLKNGTKVAWGPVTVIGPKPHVEMKGDFPVEIAFGEDLVAAESLMQLREAVRGTVREAFAMLGLPAL